MASAVARFAGRTFAANTLCGAEPEGWVTTTTLYLDRDYVIDQVFWQYAEQFTDRLDAKAFLGVWVRTW